MTMTLKEIDQKLPNGFHDSEISNLHIDYVARTLTMHISVWIGDLEKEGDEREKYRDAVVEFDGLQYCVLEAPDNRYEYASSQPLWIDMGDPKVKPDLPTNIPKQAFAESFFVKGWNSFIHIAALNVKLTWS
jgi:hypothetical protein